jgi:hypothetical protein
LYGVEIKFAMEEWMDEKTEQNAEKEKTFEQQKTYSTKNKVSKKNQMVL